MKFKINKSTLKAIDAAADKALIETAYQLQKEVREAGVVPYKTGHLQNEAFDVDTEAVAKGAVKLSFDTPYAARLYFHPEYHFSKGHNANAQAYWLEEWINGAKSDRTQTIFSEKLKKEL